MRIYEPVVRIRQCAPVPYERSTSARTATVSDLDGDIWQRQSSDPASTQRDHWRMRDHDPNEHEGAAAGVYLTPHLLTAYGPVTAVQPKAW